MATPLRGRVVESIWIDEFTHKDDGLKEFAVWADWDYEAQVFRVGKIEPYVRNKRYSPTMTGVVRAKDELDAFNFLNNRYGEGGKF